MVGDGVIGNSSGKKEKKKLGGEIEKKTKCCRFVGSIECLVFMVKMLSFSQHGIMAIQTVHPSKRNSFSKKAIIRNLINTFTFYRIRVNV